jgi:hypothetical protein
MEIRFSREGESRQIRRGGPPRPKRKEKRRRERPYGATDSAKIACRRALKHGRPVRNGITRKIQLARRSSGSEKTTRAPTTQNPMRMIVEASSGDGRLMPGVAGGWARESSRRIQKQDRESETGAQVECGNQAMLAAAEQAANAELYDGVFE